MAEEPQEGKRAHKADEGKEPQERKRDLWDPILESHDAFINNLDCIGEMVSLVLPVLNNKDEEREQRIRLLIEEVETERGLEIRMLHADVKEFFGHIRKMRQGEDMFRQGVITSIVSKFDKFLIKILKVCYRHNSGWLKNPDKRISYKELLEIESLDLLKDEIISKEIDGLMRDSHHAQLTFLDGKLKLGIEREFPSWHDFLEITERRNLFVHTAGNVSPQYLENCTRWNVSLNKEIKVGSHISASDKYIQKAIDCFYELSVRVAQATIRRMFPESLDAADSILNNQSVDLLLGEERWELAERIFDFALSIPEDLNSKGEMKYYFLLNSCIAKKFSGKPFHERLYSVDWNPFHPKYHFAVAILEDRFDDAEVLMRSQVVQDQIKEEHFKKWPLLKEFRKTEAFQNAFRDIFGKDYKKELLEEAEREIRAQRCDGPKASSADVRGS